MIIPQKKLDFYLSWAYLGYKDIVMRYRRTVLGPLWLVLATAIIVTGMTVVSSVIFKSSIADSLMYVTSGIITWLFLSTLISDSSYIFISQAGLLKNLNVDINLLCIRYFTKDLIIFLHNVAFLIILSIIMQAEMNAWFLLILPWTALFFFNFIFLCYTLGFLSARYRDIPQIVTSILTVSVLVTPIMWKVNALGPKAIYLYLNPFIHFLELMRHALLSTPPAPPYLYGAATLTLLNMLLFLYSHKKYANKVRFWL